MSLRYPNENFAGEKPLKIQPRWYLGWVVALVCVSGASHGAQSPQSLWKPVRHQPSEHVRPDYQTHKGPVCESLIVHLETYSLFDSQPVQNIQLGIISAYTKELKFGPGQLDHFLETTEGNLSEEELTCLALTLGSPRVPLIRAYQLSGRHAFLPTVQVYTRHFQMSREERDLRVLAVLETHLKSMSSVGSEGRENWLLLPGFVAAVMGALRSPHEELQRSAASFLDSIGEESHLHVFMESGGAEFRYE